MTTLFDAAALRDAFHRSNRIASQGARWCRDYPGAEPNTCRYCGKHWRQWTGSKLDGHAACIVTEDFKRQLIEILRSPTVTYGAIATAIGVTPSVVRSWTFPIKEHHVNEKTPTRLKFKDNQDSKASPAAGHPSPTLKPSQPLQGTEAVQVKCGHTIAFDLYVKDPFRDQRRTKAISRDCPPCRQDRVNADVAAAKTRRAKKATFARALKPRLPDGARFEAAYDATAVQWTGTLTIEGITFTRQGSSLNKLLYKLDDAYRASQPAVLVQEPSAGAVPDAVATS